MLEVRAYDGSLITITSEVIEHVERKHPQMVSLARLNGERLLSSVIRTLEKPDEVFVDARHARYFLMKMDDLYLNVIVTNDIVKTAYLMGERTHKRMEKTRWLRRPY